MRSGKAQLLEVDPGVMSSRLVSLGTHSVQEDLECEAYDMCVVGLTGLEAHTFFTLKLIILGKAK